MQRYRFTYSGLSVMLLILCLIAINIIGYFISYQWDFTKDKLFSISEGTQKIVTGLKDPITVKLFFSKSNEEVPLSLKTYAQRVKELLEEYVRLSRRNIKLEVYDPRPDTEEEEWAQKYGITQVPLSDGEGVHFGMVVMSLDRESKIPFFDQRREKFLEYDISQTILKVSTEKEMKIGVLSGIDVMGNTSFQMQQNRGSKEWAFISELKKSYKVQKLEPSLNEIPDDISLLLTIHPKKFSEQLQYAIDQYVLRGGRLVLLIDPNARVDAQNSRAASYGQQPDLSSNLPKLLKTWGIEYQPSKLVGDLRYATPINTGRGGVVRYPLWMSLSEDALNKSNPISSQLESLLFVEAGELKKQKDSAIEFSPIVSTSSDSGLVDAFLTRFVAPKKITQDLKPDKTTKVIMALVKGKFETAFPGGKPQNLNKEKKEGAKEKQIIMKYSHMKSAKEVNTVLVISDVDFISDSFSVQKMSFMGQTVVQPTNDNLNLLLNAIEYLSGNDDLMNIRTRGRFSRPFTKVLELQQQAQTSFQKEESRLDTELKSVQTKLRDLQQKNAPGQKLILTQEQQAEIQNFRAAETTTRRRLREVRKILRQDIELLGRWLMAINMLAIPFLIALIGTISYFRRTRQHSNV